MKNLTDYKLQELKSLYANLSYIMRKYPDDKANNFWMSEVNNALKSKRCSNTTPIKDSQWKL